MKIAFYVKRINLYKHYIPLIREAARRGYEILCLHDYSQPTGGSKGYVFPSIEEVPASIRPVVRVVTFQGPDGLSEFLRAEHEIDFVFSIYSMLAVMPGAAPEMFSSRWVVVSTVADNYLELPTVPLPAGHENKQIFLAQSPEFLRMGREYLERFDPGKERYINGEFMDLHTPGVIECDAFDGIDRERVREKYHIPEGKGVLLYLPFPYDPTRSRRSSLERAFCGIITNTLRMHDGQYIHHRRKRPFAGLAYKGYCFAQSLRDPVARRFLLNGVNEGRIFGSIRRFCERNNLFLVVKPRFKFPVAEPVRKLADLVIWDDEKQQDPPVFKEILSVSRVSVAYCSTAVTNAAYAGVFHVNISMPDVFFKNEAHGFWFPRQEDALYNFRGVCGDWYVEEASRRFEQASLEDVTVDPQRRGAYVRMYCGFDDSSASKRALDILEKYVRQEYSPAKQSAGAR